MDKINREESGEKESLNYLLLTKFSLFNNYYLYFDIDCCSLSLLYRHNVHPHVVNICQKPEEDYSMILVRISRKEIQSFIAAMDELPNKMLLCGHVDYDLFCERKMQELDEFESQMKRREGVITLLMKKLLPARLWGLPMTAKQIGGTVDGKQARYYQCADERSD